MKKYFNRVEIRVLVLMFIGLILFHIFQVIRKSNLIPETLNYITYSAFFIPLFGFIIKIKNVPVSKRCIINKNNQKYFCGVVKYSDVDSTTPNLLLRKSHKENIKKLIEEIENNAGLKGIILTGESGAGKSILVRLLKDDLDNEEHKKYNVILRQDDAEYRSMADLQILDNGMKTVIIFDGFEETLNPESHLKTWVSENLSKLENCVFIFSFPEKYFARIYSEIYDVYKNIHLESYVLNLSVEDEEAYLTKFSKAIGRGGGSDRVNEIWKMVEKDQTVVCNDKFDDYAYLLCCELKKVKKGISPLIEMEFVAENIYSLGDISNVEIDKIIEKFFDRWVSQFDDVTVAYSILSLFSDYRPYDFDDIKLLIFENEENIENYKAIMNQSSFLQLNPTMIDVIEPVHAYISESIRQYISNKEIPDGTRRYIEYYKKNSSHINYKSYLEKCNERYYSKHLVIKIVFSLMIVAMIGLAIITQNDTIENHLQRCAFIGVSFPAIYYIYNYSEYILSLKGGFLPWLTYTYGAVSIVLSYYFLNCWGIYIGAAICVLGMTIFLCLSIKCEKEAKKKLKRDALVFSSIGAVVILLGVIFANLFSSNSLIDDVGLNNWLKYSYYIQFFVYVALSDLTHIKYSYIIGRIGYANMINIGKNK